jgi:hypothetical protein
VISIPEDGDVYSIKHFVDSIYLIELEIKDTTDTDRTVSCLDLHLEIDSEGRLRTELYDKRYHIKLKIETSNDLQNIHIKLKIETNNDLQNIHIKLKIE